MRYPIHQLLTVGALMAFGGFADAAPQFEGRVAVEWLTNTPEREMRLLESFAFVDASGKRWEAPKGAIIDGASIPQSLWSLVGSPFTGGYRRASVLHDYFCDTRTETWQKVHRMFYNAMIAAAVSEPQAKVFYAAVYAAGPRWTKASLVPASAKASEKLIPKQTTVLQNATIAPPDELEVREWIRTTNPSLDQIDQRLKTLVVVNSTDVN